MAKRKKYSEEFTCEAVNLIRQPHANVSQIARDIGVSANDLWRWRREADSVGKTLPSGGLARDQELLALKRELDKVKKERDFIRDAASFFARESN